jgi:hypothetical protein
MKLHKIFKNIAITLSLFVLLFGKSYSQINCNSGENVKYSIQNFANSENPINSLTFLLKNSNPTVFYIDSIKINDEILMNFERNYWEINCFSENLNFKNISLTLYGTGLSGNDSLTELNFENIFFSENQAENLTISVKSKNNDVVQNYAKFAKITSIYPNPVISENKIKIDYLIDKNSNVKFKLFNDLGKLIDEIEIQNVEKNKQTFELIIDKNLPNGAYFILLETNSGKYVKSFCVAK